MTKCKIYTTTFQKGTSIWNLYQRLKKSGVKDSDIDQGYYEIDYVKKQRDFLEDKEGDCVIEEEEVLEYVLAKERYEKWRVDIQETTGIEIAWDLDQTTEIKVQEAISAFKQILKSKGYKEGSEQFNELLAVSLYAFTLASKRRPEWGIFGKILIPVIPEDAGAELTQTNLNDVINYIRVNGGLGLMFIPKDCEFEGQAANVLAEECGACSEESSVLYSVFIKAGLPAEFGYQGPRGNQYQGHSFVILRLKTKERHFDPTWKDSNAIELHNQEFSGWVPQTNREFMAVHYTNLGKDYQNKNDYAHALAAFNFALQLNKRQQGALINRCVLYASYQVKDHWDLAISDCENAIRINPVSEFAYYDLGFVYSGMQRFDLAEKEYKKALELSPDLIQAHTGLSKIYYRVAAGAARGKERLGYLNKALDEINKAQALGGKIPEGALEDLYMQIRDEEYWIEEQKKPSWQKQMEQDRRREWFNNQ